MSLFSSAQQWMKTYGPGYWADWVIEYYDKGYVILGTKSGSAGYCWVIKTDINGNMLWNKKIGNGIDVMFGNNIEQTTDNGLIIAGTTSKYGNQQDAYILKLNSCGNLEWCSDIYTPTIPWDLGWRVKPTSDNGYLLLGLYNSPNENLRTNLFKFDALGNLLWHQAYLPDSAAFEDDAQDILVNSSSYYITAVVYYPDPGQGGGWERFYSICTDTAGNKIWSNIYGLTNYYHGFPSTTLRNNKGDYYSFGCHDINGTNYTDPCIVKVLSDGSSSYNKDILTNVYGGGIGTGDWLNENTLILGGGWALNANSAVDALFETDTLGNLLQSIILDTISTGITNTAKTFDNKFISIATDCPTTCHIVAYKVNSDLQYDSVYTRHFTYDSLCPHPVVSDTIDPVCGLIVNVEEPFSKPETRQLKVFPNPASGMLTVIFPQYLMVSDNNGPVKSKTVYHQWKSTFLEIYNLNGERLFQKEIPKDQTRLELDVSSWPKGMYLFRLIYNKQTVAGEKVIIK
ncbi:MAG: T9SS type A sorting domain-containing protein [Bacteroidetes bacterium]|nr:T9SS type A sorting domain-containing protein [Bacteroidota bacterium]